MTVRLDENCGLDCWKFGLTSIEKTWLRLIHQQEGWWGSFLLWSGFRRIEAQWDQCDDDDEDDDDDGDDDEMEDDGSWWWWQWWYWCWRCLDADDDAIGLWSWFVDDNDDPDYDDVVDENHELEKDVVHLALLLPPALPHHVVNKTGQSENKFSQIRDKRDKIRWYKINFLDLGYHEKIVELSGITQI